MHRIRLGLQTLVIMGVLLSSARADTWTWDPDETNGASPGGDGAWDDAAVNWWDGAGNRAWVDDASTSASISDGTATLGGQRVVDSLTLGASATLDVPQEDLTNRLTVRGDIAGDGAVRFTGKWTVSRYDPALMNTGLRFEGGGARTVDAEFKVEKLDNSPVITVSGSETLVVYRGAWKGDGGQTHPHLFLRDGGTFVLHADAELDFINNAYFTRQLWISGGGPEESDGVLEFAPGFIADRTEDGTVDKGLGSIRLNHAVVVTPPHPKHSRGHASPPRKPRRPPDQRPFRV